MNIDSHSDLGVYELGKEPTIGSFITYLVYGGFLKKYLWIKNNKNLNEFEDGFYKSSLWLDKNNTLVLTFLKQNFDIKKCLGIVLCKSESSGYTKKRKCTIYFGQS